MLQDTKPHCEDNAVLILMNVLKGLITVILPSLPVQTQSGTLPVHVFLGILDQVSHAQVRTNTDATYLTEKNWTTT